jgi:hypothetical protein
MIGASLTGYLDCINLELRFSLTRLALLPHVRGSRPNPELFHRHDPSKLPMRLFQEFSQFLSAPLPLPI